MLFRLAVAVALVVALDPSGRAHAREPAKEPARAQAAPAKPPVAAKTPPPAPPSGRPSGDGRDSAAGATPGKQRQRACIAEWRSLTAAEKTAKGPVWPQFYSKCVKRLKGAQKS